MQICLEDNLIYKDSKLAFGKRMASSNNIIQDSLKKKIGELNKDLKQIMTNIERIDLFLDHPELKKITDTV